MVPRVSTVLVVSLVNLQLAHPLASLVSKERRVSRVRSVPTAWMALAERLVLPATRARRAHLARKAFRVSRVFLARWVVLVRMARRVLVVIVAQLVLLVPLALVVLRATQESGCLDRMVRLAEEANLVLRVPKVPMAIQERKAAMVSLVRLGNMARMGFLARMVSTVPGAHQGKLESRATLVMRSSLSCKCISTHLKDMLI